MKFSLVIDMERYSPSADMREEARHVLEMVQMADRGGFEIVWAAEHHAIEMTIAPGPFQLLAWYAGNTGRPPCSTCCRGGGWSSASGGAPTSASSTA